MSGTTKDTKDTKTAEQILFPERVVCVRVGMRTLTLVVRPFTMRQLRAIKMGLAEPLTAATGLTRKQAGKLKPHVAIALQRVIDEVNAWKPEELETTKTEGAARSNLAANSKHTKEEEDDFYGMAAELVMAGHDRESVWDLTPVQFVWWVNQARRLRARDTRECAALDAAGVFKAIAGAFSKGGAKELASWVKLLTADETTKPSEARRSAEGDPQGRAERSERVQHTKQSARTPGRGLQSVLAQAGETLQEGALNRG